MRRRIIYLDTSFLTPIFLEDATFEKVASFLSRQAAGTPAVSKCASVEFTSLISRDVHVGALMPVQGQRLIEEFDSMVAAFLVVLIPGGNDFDLAQQYITSFATQLRGSDAMHLAVTHNNGVEFITTLDDGILPVAKKLKIPVRPVIR